MDAITYFETPGEQNTDAALKIAKDYATKNGIKRAVVASTNGNTAKKAVQVFSGTGVEVVVVTHAAGFKEPDIKELPDDLREQLEAKGVKVLTATFALSGISKLVDSSLGNIIANSLRILCQGMKVCVECVAMAADAGLVSTREDVVAVAGTKWGADTVAVIKPATSRALFEMNVKKILAKPIKP
jgi:hypothetical protein